jgi:pimeloyl-ACP methyl ester carboxylesterase
VSATDQPRLQRVSALGRDWDIELAWSGDPEATRTLVLLHEGLGSVAMWKDFPHALAEATGCRVLSYSRPGYGQSTPRAPHERWAPSFMHDQALVVLPALLDALDLHAPVHLLGHSDGGSIALLAAAHRPERVASCVVMAPHTHVEDISVRSIQRAREAFEAPDGKLRHSLSRYHADVNSAFYGWNDIWLSPAFRHWNIEADTEHIRCPLLAIQGLDDEYGTLAQIRGLRHRCRHTQLLELAACGHSPHRDQPSALLKAVADWLGRS